MYTSNNIYSISITLAKVVAKAAPATPIGLQPKLPNINIQFKNALLNTPIKLAYIVTLGCSVLLNADEYA